MSIALLLALAAYAWIIGRRWFAWEKLPVLQTRLLREPLVRLTVIIPVRNEAANMLLLLEDLERQTYPKHLFDVLVMDDSSDDGTPSLIREYAKQSRLQLNVVQLANYVNLAGKKAAVDKGVELATGELLLFTDGDCRVQPAWLALFAQTYITSGAWFISGPVSFHNTDTLFQKMQLVEFASLIGIGGASIALGKPNMCNGANLGYTKKAFQLVGGFAGNEGIASGDDEFLLHKLHERHPEKISFLRHPEAIVFTEARKTLSSFIAQRVRWASKWKAYQNLNVQLVALVVFLVNALLFLAIPAVLVRFLPLNLFVAAYVIKFAIDFIFLNRILRFLGKAAYLWYMLPLQLVYIPYIVFTAIGGLFGRYSWKGRTIRNT